METLEELRVRLDEIDDQIVNLYEQRMEICAHVGEYKIQTGKKVLDRQREKEKLENVAGKASNPFNKKGVTELYEQLMSMSRKLQYEQLVKAGALGRLPFIQVDSLDADQARVVFPGTEGAYSEAAMKRYFGENCNSFYVRTFREAMEAIEDGAADFAVLPIENSTAGAVDEMYDLLVEFENYIVGETVIPIRHTLSGLPGASLKDVKTVYSKGVALMQATHFLDAHSSWQRINVANTAIAAKKVVEDQDLSQAAVCSAYAAKVHGLQKISICLEVSHESGSLYRVLSHFIYNDLNMTKIESRPIEGRDWEYRFFIDFEGNMADGAVKNAIRGLREECRNLRILGNY